MPAEWQSPNMLLPKISSPAARTQDGIGRSEATYGLAKDSGGLARLTMPRLSVCGPDAAKEATKAKEKVSSVHAWSGIETSKSADFERSMGTPSVRPRRRSIGSGESLWAAPARRDLAPLPQRTPSIKETLADEEAGVDGRPTEDATSIRTPTSMSPPRNLNVPGRRRSGSMGSQPTDRRIVDPSVFLPKSKSTASEGNSASNASPQVSRRSRRNSVESRGKSDGSRIFQLFRYRAELAKVDMDGMLSGKVKPEKLLSRLSAKGMEDSSKSVTGSSETLNSGDIIATRILDDDDVDMNMPTTPWGTGYRRESSDRLTPMVGSRSNTPTLSPRLSDTRRRRPSIGSADTTHSELLDSRKKMESTNARRANAKKRWTWAITSVRKLLLSTLVFKKSDPSPFGPSAQGMLAEIQQKENIMVGCRIANILAIPSAKRTDAQEKLLDTLLIHIQSFAKLPAPVRRAMARYATLLHVAPGRLIIKAGHSPLFVYFLLSGACIATDPATSDVRSYSAGECFGAVPLSDPAAPRKVTIEAVVETMLFAVPVDEYVQAVTTGDGTDGAMPIWQCFGPFKDTPPELLKQLMVIATAARYEANQIILPPEERKNICFLIRGTCKILRRVPFVLKRTDIGPPACSPAATPNLSDRSSRPSTSVSLRSSVSSDEPRTSNGLYAVPPGTMPCELLQGEQLIYRMLSLGELEPHAHFPPLRLLQTEAAVYRSQSISSTKVDILQRAVERQYDSHWKNTQSAATKIRAPRDSAQGASEYERESLAAALDMTVLATTPCEVLVIPKMDLVRILDVESIRQLVDPDYEGVVGTRVEDVQKEYLSAKRWETGRASIVAEYRGRNRSSSVGTATGYKRAKEVPS